MLDAVDNRTGKAGLEPDRTLASVIQWVESSEDEGQTARERSERDRDYYDGRQLTTQEEKELLKRGQLPSAFNLVRQKIEYLLGMEKQQRSDPKAYPRNPDDEQAADAATDGIRYVCDDNQMPMVASGVWEEMIVEGASGVDVCVEPEDYGFCVKLHWAHWDRMIWDPYSRERDFSDAKFLGTIAWMDEADVLARWPDAGDVVGWTFGAVSNTSAWDDRPRWNVWADADRHRVRVVQLYWREGMEWHCGTFVRGGWLEPPQPSPYKDERGRSECPLIFVSCYVNRDNWRYGVVRDLIDPQDEINIRHRKAIHLLSVRQVIAEEGAVQDVDKARQELAKPDGYVEVAPGMRFEIQQTGDLSAGQAALLNEAKSMFNVMGPNAALMGKQGNSASGRAIALSQQGGAMEIGTILDVHRHWRRRVYRAVWNRIKQFWTEEKWVRVTDDEDKLRWVGLNRPVTLGDKLMAMPPEEAMMLAGQMGIASADDPRLAQVVEIENDVARLDVDIVVEEGPDVATLQQEEFAKIADLARAGVPIPPDVLIQASGLRGKDKILERIKSGGIAPNEPPPPPPPEVQEALADVEKAKADAEKAMAEAEIKKLELAQMQAGLMPLPGAAPALPAHVAEPAVPAPMPQPAGPMVAIQLGPEVEQAIAAQNAGTAEAIAQLAGGVQQMAAILGQGQGELMAGQAQLADGQAQTQAAIADLARIVAAPSEIVRDQAGRVAGSRKVI